MNRVEIIGQDAYGNFIIRPDTEEDREELLKLQQKRVIEFDMIQADRDRLTAQQRKKANALIRDINKVEEKPKISKKHQLKLEFCAEYNLEYFSLKNCHKEVAGLFISFLVEYCFEHDIDFYMKDLHLTFDIQRQMYLCAIHNRCFVTAARKDQQILHLHHVNVVGSGNNRKKIDHRGRYFMILSAELHEEIHKLGYKSFCAKYHIGAIKLTGEDVLRFKLMTKQQLFEIDDEQEIQSWQLPD